ncbi:hypothetical protein FJT64_009658 [Amphibalanus amphitrite]|uniref:Uncharacterized protein n=1 Tax=Amphibalanus amphitrite TaxID=1232801 RepID=A0A6A4VCS6_AMPAM|nr:hypothetical protein FJT64_009658 [Amphibalanus amphitrite]
MPSVTMVAAELAMGMIFVAVCVSIPPCLLIFSSSIERLFVLKNKFSPAEVDTETEPESSSDGSDSDKSDGQDRESNPRRRHSGGTHRPRTGDTR